MPFIITKLVGRGERVFMTFDRIWVSDRVLAARFEKRVDAYNHARVVDPNKRHNVVRDW